MTFTEKENIIKQAAKQYTREHKKEFYEKVVIKNIFPERNKNRSVFRFF